MVQRAQEHKLLFNNRMGNGKSIIIKNYSYFSFSKILSGWRTHLKHSNQFLLLNIFMVFKYSYTTKMLNKLCYKIKKLSPSQRLSFLQRTFSFILFFFKFTIEQSCNCCINHLLKFKRLDYFLN